MASSPGTGVDLNSSPPAPASDSSSSPPADSSTSSSPTPAAASSPPPVEESPPQSPPPSIDPPPSSPPPTVESSPPPTVESPPSTSSPPPSPPSESQPSPSDSSSSNNSPSPPSSNNSPSPPASSVSPSTPANNQTPVFIPPPRSSDKTPPGSIGRPFPPTSTSNPDAPAPPRHSQGSFRPSPGSSSSSSSDSGSRDALIIGVIVGGIFILALVIVCLLCSKKKKKQPYYSDPRHPPKGGEQYWNGGRPNDHVVKLSTPPSNSWGPPPPGPNPSSSDYSSSYSGQQQPGYGPPSPNVGGMMGGYNQSQFTYEELSAATGGFAQTNLLGQGGFGYVHKGVLPNGKEVAVKSLKSGSGQGEREFQAEVEIISRVHHRHLVSLVGYCISGEQRMLVYEFVPNNTMEFHLHGKGQPVMEWQTRMLIALGSAKGLAYLHEDCNPRIIHRDIKSANILLDDNYEAMVADFGLAKLTTDNFTHISTRVMGTFGYMAPEYASSGKLTEKSDVFSYGIMLLELITGRRPIDLTNSNMEDGLVDWARPLIPQALEKDDFSELVDPRLEGNYDHHEMARMIACASACVRHSARRRPKMSQIIRALDGNSSLDDLNEVPKKSPSTISSRVISETNAYDTGMYNADMMKFRKMVLNSEEYNPSEDGLTSEYGLNPSASSSDEFVSKQQKKPY